MANFFFFKFDLSMHILIEDIIYLTFYAYFIWLFGHFVRWAICNLHISILGVAFAFVNFYCPRDESVEKKAKTEGEIWKMQKEDPTYKRHLK
jgi:mannose/fructose/N-acetylgalactosamine-specific phosphotransferase system component IIC